jgi:transposase
VKQPKGCLWLPQHSLIGSRLTRWASLGEIGKAQKPLTEVEMELARTKKELAEVKMERDILKKAAAYFARESLHGMRQ